MASVLEMGESVVVLLSQPHFFESLFRASVFALSKYLILFQKRDRLNVSLQQVDGDVIMFRLVVVSMYNLFKFNNCLLFKKF